MSSSRLPRSLRAPARGFTLIELMVVILIISVLAVIAVPSVVERLRERRSAEAAQRIASLYRSARLRAMGRGAAVVVRYQNRGFEVREAVQGAGSARPGCQTMPLSSCLAADFVTPGNFLAVSEFLPTRFEGVDLTATDATAGATATTRLDVCYTPLGRAFTRVADGAFDPMAGVATFTVGRTGGLARRVTVLPNGVSRLAL